MATIKAISSRASIGIAVNYITRNEKTDIKLVTGINCSPETAIDEMKLTKTFWNKNGGRQYKHYVQSFPPDEEISHETAHEIAVRLCEERFKDFEVIIATHKDRDHVHSHIIVNSVSCIDGHKIQESRKDLQAMKDYSDRLCEEYGLSICVKNDEITAYKKEKYKALEKALTSNYKSYVLECYKAVSAAAAKGLSKEDFINILAQAGYTTSWTERKYITFTDKDGKKIRNSNLEKTFKEHFGKEELENGFKSNAERARSTETAEQLRTDIKDSSRAVLDTVRTAIDKSNAAIGADDRRRNDRKADRERQTARCGGTGEREHKKKRPAYRSEER